jgi:hypothetical protein
MTFWSRFLDKKGLILIKKSILSVIEMKKTNLVLISIFLTTLMISSIPYLNAVEADFVLEGNETYQIFNKDVSWKRNLILKDNAKLIVDNGTLQFVEDSPQEYRIVLYNHSRLILKNHSTLAYGGPFSSNPIPISVTNNSHFEVSDSTIDVGVAVGGNSEVQIKNSELIKGLGVNGFSKTVVENSSIKFFGVGDRANVTVSNSNISALEAVGNSEFRAFNSSIGYDWERWDGIYLSTDENSSIWMTNCSLGIDDNREEMNFDGFSTVWLINCDLGKGKFNVQGFGTKVFIAYYLNVDVEPEEDVPIEEVLVSVYYNHNSSLAEQAKVDLDGNVKFVLPQWILQKFGGMYTGEYKIVTNLDNGFNETDVTLDSSKKIVISQFTSYVSDDEPISDDKSELTTLEIILLLTVITLFSVIVALIYFIKRGRGK